MELSASTWLVIAQDGIGKKEALQLLGFGNRMIGPADFNHDCPCCEYVKAQGSVPHGGADADINCDRGCEQVCPLDGLWPKGCEYPTSPFARWEVATEKGKRKYAMEIAKFSGTLAGTWSPELEELT